MVLVFLFIFIIILSMLFILLSTLKINIKKLELSNEIKNTPIIKELEITIGIYFLNKIRIFAKHTNKKNLQNIRNLKSLEKLKNKLINNNTIKENKQNVKLDIDIIKQLEPKLQKIDLNLNLGTEDVILTSFLICIISIAISMILSKSIEKYDENKYKYKITPNYNNENSIKITLNSIIDVKLVNIISIIFKLWLRSDKFDKRTSDRRSYDNCNEQYTRNGRCKYNYRGTN